MEEIVNMFVNNGTAIACGITTHDNERFYSTD